MVYQVGILKKTVALKHRDYTFLGLTQSLCPTCRRLVPAKIIAREGRVYFRKRCPEHGERDDFICSDVTRYDLTSTSLPAKLPQETFTTSEHGCPLDCGLCEQHEQHTCIGVIEITDGSTDYNTTRFRETVFMDLTKTAVNRLAFGEGHKLAPLGCCAVAVTPDWLRSEMMLDVFGVTEDN